jgi:SAM-dependent methyltransferase
VLGGRTRAVQAVWESTVQPPITFWHIPQVHQRANRLVSGDPQVDYISYVARKYLAGRSLAGISLGCGAGHKELQWASCGNFSRLDAYDLSPQRIATAKAAARARGIDNVHFHVGDIYRLDWPPAQYDVVLCDQSLHHFAQLESLYANVRRALKPDGYFVLNEYIGPARFQWTARQLEAVNALLALLPPRYRSRWQDHGLKRRVHRPSRLSMMLYDPSEAVESDKIVPCLDKFFAVVERRDYGGTLLHPLFADIAWNFKDDRPEIQQLLQLCFEVEDAMLAQGEVTSDFALIVCKPRPDVP